MGNFEKLVFLCVFSSLFKLFLLLVTHLHPEQPAVSAGVAPGISDEGLTLPTRGLKYGFRVLYMPKISEKVAFHLPTGG